MTTHLPPQHASLNSCTITDSATYSALSQLTPDDLAVLAETFRLLGDPSRLKILFQCIRGPMPVGELAEAAGLSQPLASHHLRLLRAARLVRSERQGKHVFYEIADHHVSHVLHDMAIHIHEEHS